MCHWVEQACTVAPFHMALQRTLHTYSSSYHKQFHLNCIHTMIIDYNSLKLCIMIWWLIWVHVHRSAASLWIYIESDCVAMNKTGITYDVQTAQLNGRMVYVRAFRYGGGAPFHRRFVLQIHCFFVVSINCGRGKWGAGIHTTHTHFHWMENIVFNVRDVQITFTCVYPNLY